jgi:hypothetical protein
VGKLVPKFVSGGFIAKIVDNANNFDIRVLGLDFFRGTIQHILTATSDDYTVGGSSSK